MERPSAPAPREGLETSLWFVQILLGCLYFISGVMKTSAELSQLATNLPWTQDVASGLVRFIGVVEIVGAMGVVLPAATRVAPKLTGFAGLGLAVLMALATGFHATRGEWSVLPMTLALCGLAAFVAWGRLVAAPIPPSRVDRSAGPATKV